MSALKEANGLEIGDSVWVGEPRPDKVHWRLTGLHEVAPGRIYATIRSGMTERSWVQPIERLQLHSRGKK